jgi:hypothetical protein
VGNVARIASRRGEIHGSGGGSAVSSSHPPRDIRLSLDEALALLADLEDARDALIDSDRLAVVVGGEGQIRLLNRRLGFDDPEGGADVD